MFSCGTPQHGQELADHRKRGLAYGPLRRDGCTRRPTRAVWYLGEGLLVRRIGFGGQDDVACVRVADLDIMFQSHLVDRLALARRDAQRLP